MRTLRVMPKPPASWSDARAEPRGATGPARLTGWTNSRRTSGRRSSRNQLSPRLRHTSATARSCSPRCGRSGLGASSRCFSAVPISRLGMCDEIRESASSSTNKRRPTEESKQPERPASSRGRTANSSHEWHPDTFPPDFRMPLHATASCWCSRPAAYAHGHSRPGSSRRAAPARNALRRRKGRVRHAVAGEVADSPRSKVTARGRRPQPVLSSSRSRIGWG